MLNLNISWKSSTGSTLLTLLHSQERIPFQFIQFLSNATGIPVHSLRYYRRQALHGNNNRSIQNIMEKTRKEKIPLSVKLNILTKIIEKLPFFPRLSSLQAIAIQEFQTKDNLYRYLQYHHPDMSKTSLQAKVKKLLNDTQSSRKELNDLFSASKPWIVKLLKDAGISRYSIHNSPNLVDQSYAMVFIKLLAQALIQNGRSLVLNLDETSIRINNQPYKAYNFKDDRKKVDFAVKDSKVCFTAVCIVGADGNKYDPLIIAKGTTERCGKDIDSLEEEGYSFQKLFSPKGWMNHDTMLKTLEYVSSIRNSIDPSKEVVLVLDVFRAHLDPAVVKSAKEKNIRLITVPANGTGTYQTLDVGVFGVLKQILRRKYQDWIQKLNSHEEIHV